MRCPYTASIRYLARREHSAQELTTKLLSKGYSSSEIQETLVRLQAENLQSDARFIESLIRWRSAQGKGPLRIAQELTEHGFTRAQIKSALETAEVCWVTLATQVRIQKFGEELPSDFSDKAKQLRFLQYRGFDSEQIKLATKINS